MNATDSLAQLFDGMASAIDATGVRTIAFTSTLLGEGVSTIAIGAALSLAALRQEAVLLVDANWIQPSLTIDAGLEAAPGLGDYLGRREPLEAVVRPAAPSRPTFLPIGDRTAARPTLSAISSLVTRDAASYRTVVVDLPPLLAGESFVLPWVSLLDQLFVVLRESATPLPAVRQALAKVVGTTTPQIVLNRGVATSPDIAASFRAVRA
jgi:polysaccharide biosynthesis transport protein